MKKLASLVVIAGLFAVTGCNKCLNCNCDMTQTTTQTTVTTDGVGGSDTVINTNTNTGSSSVNPACDGDRVMLDNHQIDSGNINGTHTYVDTGVNVSDNLWDNGTTTTTTETTTTYTCTCDAA